MHRLMTGLARALAIVGGLVLIAIVVLTCLSVIGRIFNGIGHADFVANYLPILGPFFKAFGPINGDYELVEAGIALAIFLFLPWCQLNRGHATVELFTAKFPASFNRWLSLFWEVVFAATILLITWRLYVGMTDKMRYGETTFLLQMPVWWAFAACSLAAILASLVAIYSTYLRAREAISGQISASEIGSTGA
ncbi:MAG: TRAP transporter small permease [Rhizobiaceae bacterium]